MKKTTLTNKTKFQPRAMRVFSEDLKRKLVEEIENKRLTIKDVVNLYHVSSTSVYNWLSLYSSFKRTGARIVMESDSKETKIEKLMQRIKELERSVGKKQLEIEFLDKALEMCSRELGYDVKKKYSTMSLNGTK